MYVNDLYAYSMGSHIYELASLYEYSQTSYSSLKINTLWGHTFSSASSYNNDYSHGIRMSSSISGSAPPRVPGHIAAPAPSGRWWDPCMSPGLTIYSYSYVGTIALSSGCE
jgi:hypothetical protein